MSLPLASDRLSITRGPSALGNYSVDILSIQKKQPFSKESPAFKFHQLVPFGSCLSSILNILRSTTFNTSIDCCTFTSEFFIAISVHLFNTPFLADSQNQPTTTTQKCISQNLSLLPSPLSSSWAPPQRTNLMARMAQQVSPRALPTPHSPPPGPHPFRATA